MLMYQYLFLYVMIAMIFDYDTSHCIQLLNRITTRGILVAFTGLYRNGMFDKWLMDKSVLPVTRR